MDIIHRDLKPENVLVSEEGQAVLCDFETSKANANSLMLGTVTKVVSGVYTAPEVLRPGGDHSQKSDIYSFGVITAQVLAGDLAADPRKLLTAASFSKQELELLKSLLHENPSKRPSTGQLLFHPLFRERPRTGKCSICMENVSFAGGLQCQGGHFTCGSCLSGHAANFSAADMQRKGVKV